MNAKVIAIDGPAASGKSTVARRVAAALGWHYVDSGALYRGVTWKALRDGVSTGDGEALVRMMDGARIELFAENGAVRFRIDGTDPGLEIRRPEVNEHVSPVAVVPGVRQRIVELLRGMTRLGNLVVEGRDIGTVVFPETPWKFYLDASAEERARRRHTELQDLRLAPESRVDDVKAALGRRDKIDSTRQTAPLRVAGDAVTIDSTAMGIEEVVRTVLARVNAGA